MKKNLTLVIPAILLAFNTGTMAQNEFSGKQTGIGMVCPDLEKSMDFYLKVIGMIRTGGFEVDESFAKASGLSNGVPFHVEVLKLEDSPDASTWKLMSFGKESAPNRSEFIQDEAGMQYITLNVTSLNPFIARFREHGIKMLGQTPVPLGNGERHFVLVRAPEGTFIELIGPLE